MLTVESLSQDCYSVRSEHFQEKKERAAGKERASRREEKKKDKETETEERSCREVECSQCEACSAFIRRDSLRKGKRKQKRKMREGVEQLNAYGGNLCRAAIRSEATATQFREEKERKREQKKRSEQMRISESKRKREPE
jgi:hypothetical protein